jgi:hypothetical protein
LTSRVSGCRSIIRDKGRQRTRVAVFARISRLTLYGHSIVPSCCLYVFDISVALFFFYTLVVHSFEI